MYLFSFLEWDPVLPGLIRCKPCIGCAYRIVILKWFENALSNINNYAGWCLRISIRLSVRLYFAIFRCWQEKFVVRWFYWSAQTIRVVSQIYREQNNRGDVSQSENADDTITDKTDWTIMILLSLIGLFVVVIWNGKGKYLWMKLLLAFSLNYKHFLRNRKKEKETAFWLSMLAFPYSLELNKDIYIDLSYFCDMYYI